jgi:predicted nucleic acid-binding protein
VIIIDSCVYITLLRQGIDPAQEFSLLAEEEDIATCGVVRCEIIRGARSPKARKALSGFLDCLLYIPTLNNVWEAAEDILWSCDRAGHIIPLTDAVIAACAMKADAAVLTYDKHFGYIPGLRVVRDYPGQS